MKKEKLNQRGKLTEDVQRVALARFGYRFADEPKLHNDLEPARAVDELRLIPYVLHCVLNGGLGDKRKINRAEYRLLCKWRDAGLVDFRLLPVPRGADEESEYQHLEKRGLGHYFYISCTREFWDRANDVVWQAYVVQGNAETRKAS